MTGETIGSLVVGNAGIRLIVMLLGLVGGGVAGGANIVAIGRIVFVVGIGAGKSREGYRAAVVAGRSCFDHVDVAAAVRIVTISTVYDPRFMGDNPVLNGRPADAMAGGRAVGGGRQQAHIVAGNAVKVTSCSAVMAGGTHLVSGNIAGNAVGAACLVMTGAGRT